jgi:probable LLM family oxidoreductase
MAASAPAITLAAAAGLTENIRLSSAVVVLSSADPVRTYQDFATLDGVSGGRAELMVGRGSFVESFPLFGYSLEDYETLFTEKLDLLLSVRDNETVSWSGTHRAPIDGRGVYPRSVQDPLPVWVAVGGTPQSVVRAGALGLPLALAIIGGDPARFRPLTDLYRRALEEAGHDPATPLAVHAHGFVGEADDEVAELVWPAYSAGMNRIGKERGWPPLTKDQYEWMRGPQGNLVMGSPGTVAAKIEEWRELLGIDRFMLHGVGALPHDRVLRSIELLGTEVAPKVR